MTPVKVPLEDIADVVGFSGAVARRLARNWTPDELEEARAQGVALLYELHGVWDPARCPSFYSFCTTYLQLRLIDWWRREARQRNLAHQAPGQRSGQLVYHGRVSLDELLWDGGGTGELEDEDGDGTRGNRALVTQDSHRLGD